MLNFIILLENRYNFVYVKMRNIIERVFGVFKLRFRCIDFSGGIFFYILIKVCRIVVVVVVLYNLCVDNNVLLLDEYDLIDYGYIRGIYY